MGGREEWKGRLVWEGGERKRGREEWKGRLVWEGGRNGKGRLVWEGGGEEREGGMEG